MKKLSKWIPVLLVLILLCLMASTVLIVKAIEVINLRVQLIREDRVYLPRAEMLHRWETWEEMLAALKDVPPRVYCPICEGSGKFKGDKCPICEGTGDGIVVLVDEAIKRAETCIVCQERR